MYVYKYMRSNFQSADSLILHAHHTKPHTILFNPFSKGRADTRVGYIHTQTCTHKRTRKKISFRTFSSSQKVLTERSFKMGFFSN